MREESSKPLGLFEDLEDNTQNTIRWSGRKLFEVALDAKFEEAHNVLLSKHKDYGPTNISQAPGGPLNGLRVRMHDKLARINHLIDNGADPEHESLRDSFLDLANYAIIGLMVIDDHWEK